MGWSSWYAFGHDVTQAKMEAAFDRLVDRSIGPGGTRSLSDYGYKFANLDDCWQACGSGVNGSFHDASGKPLVNEKRFPDFKGMTSKATELGLKPGFYYNNYVCAEPMPAGGLGGATYMLNMRGSVDFLMENGIKYVKVDSGSVYNDMQLWHDLIEEVGGGEEITVENCHQGGQEPNETWCPFDLFRTSGDAQVVGFDVEVATTASVLNKSRPGCWAYPDTLSILGSVQETRSQFGVYAVMSAPLILSFDILQDQYLLPYWDIFTNTEAIEVDQAWAGSPGGMVKQWRPQQESDLYYAAAESCNPEVPEQAGWYYDQATLQVKWLPGGGDGKTKKRKSNREELDEKEELCLTSGHGINNALSLEACKEGNGTHGQMWLPEGRRLWQVEEKRSDWRVLHGFLNSQGVLTLNKCSDKYSRPGQFWTMSAPPGRSEQTVVKNNLTFQEGSCWGITNCDSSDEAEVTVDFGCKDLPKPNWTDKCLANEAWSFNPNGTITSVMDGQCLSVDMDDKTRRVDVARCGEERHQQRWVVQPNGQISLQSQPSMCIDSGIVSPPPGSNGHCASLHQMPAGVEVADLPVESAPKLSCDASRQPHDDQPQYIRLEEGRLKVKDRCVAGRLGYPSPFGPLQLWSKPLPFKKVAVFVMNRDSQELPVEFNLTEIPHLLGPDVHQVLVRDVWSHADLPPMSNTSSMKVSLGGGDSIFYILSPVGEEFTVLTRTSHILSSFESHRREVLLFTLLLSCVIAAVARHRCLSNRRRESRSMELMNAVDNI